MSDEWWVMSDGNWVMEIEWPFFVGQTGSHYPLGENQNLQRKSWNPNAKFNSEISTLDRWLATQIVNLHPNRQSHFTLFHTFFFF